MKARKALLLLGVLVPLAACQTPRGPAYTSSANVRAPCGGQYMVGTKPNSTTLLVTPYIFTAAVRSACETDPASPLRTGVAYEAGARAYLSETLKKPQCEVVSGTRVTALHSEFTFRCP